jgi:hypothetical protein
LPWPRHIWKSIWFSVRRSGKDARARKALVALCAVVAGACFYVAWTGWWFFHASRDSGMSPGWTAAFYVFIFGTGLLARFWMTRSNRRADEALHFSLTGASRWQPSAAGASAAVRDYLRNRLLILAWLVLRAASEQYLRQKTIPANAEVVTRQLHNRALREAGAWESLEPEERDLLFVADGQWTDAQIEEIVAWTEQLRLLRWALRIDAEIVPLEHFPCLDATPAREILAGKMPPEAETLQPSDVRPERDTALAYAARCLAELKTRGLSDAGSGEWAETIRAGCLGDSTDLLAGARTVADLDDAELRLLTTMAIARERYASWLVETLGSDEITPLRRQS